MNKNNLYNLRIHLRQHLDDPNKTVLSIGARNKIFSIFNIYEDSLTEKNERLIYFMTKTELFNK